MIETITIIAILVGPILAVQVQKWIEKGNEAKNRKVGIFKTLMATRGNVLSISHVEALNRIDLEFSSASKYRQVISAWNEYFNHLSIDVVNFTDSQMEVWINTSSELLATLLFEMGRSLGYKFDKALIKRNIYSPSGHFKVESELQSIRHGLMEILKEGIIPMSIESQVVDEAAVKKQQDLQDLLLKYYAYKLQNAEGK